MTEDEAKTKWCPMSRVQSGDVAYNRYAGTPPDVFPTNSRCLGSACMMWRWHQEKNEQYIPPNPMVVSIGTHPADRVSPWKDSTTSGYCGMAR